VLWFVTLIEIIKALNNMINVQNNVLLGIPDAFTMRSEAGLIEYNYFWYHLKEERREEKRGEERRGEHMRESRVEERRGERRGEERRGKGERTIIIFIFLFLFLF
jgi:hypothetical protein